MPLPAFYLWPARVASWPKCATTGDPQLPSPLNRIAAPHVCSHRLAGWPPNSRSHPWPAPCRVVAKPRTPPAASTSSGNFRTLHYRQPVHCQVDAESSTSRAATTLTSSCQTSHATGKHLLGASQCANEPVKLSSSQPAHDRVLARCAAQLRKNLSPTSPNSLVNANQSSSESFAA